MLYLKMKSVTLRAMKNVLLGFNVDNYAARSTLAGILKFASRKSAWELRIATAPDRMTADMVRRAPAEKIDGIIANDVADETVARALAETPLPISLIECADRLVPERKTNIARACTRNPEIGALGARHFLDLGRFRSYAFAPHQSGAPWSVERQAGFIDEMAKHGICPEILTGALNKEITKLAKPAAVMAAWDYKAIEIMVCARKAGLKVPDDIAVIGVDADPLVCEFTNPPLTSVAPDFEGLGYAAAEALDDMMCGRRRRTCTKIYQPPKGIVKRASSHYLPTGRSLVDRAKAIIEKDAANGLTIKALALRLNASPQLLSMRFRQFGDVSPHELITHTRLEKVKAMLISSNAGLADIASQCGFNSANRLSHLFKSRFGITLTTYRSNHRPT